jgi:hypothetical protein
MTTKLDVLNLEADSHPARDRQMATLVCNYLRYQGYNVMEGYFFNGYHLMNIYKPTVLFISNAIGSRINHRLMKYAYYKKILGVSLVSEGNFTDGKENVTQFLWGWNKDKFLYETIHMQWTERTRTLSLTYFPELKDKIKASGGVGFDVYKIVTRPKKLDFLQKYHKEKYKKVIGVGCWNFGLFYSEDPRYSYYQDKFSEAILNRFKEDGIAFNKIICSIIEKNSDILFLLKEHPTSLLGRKASAIEGTEQFSNALIIKNEESIFDCISISDFWIAYESTTALESWLLEKQTCLLNPSGVNFPRDNLYKGSPNFSSINELQQAIDVFFTTGRLLRFDTLEPQRRKIINDVIQWDDGLNHVRAGNQIIELLEQNKTQKTKIFTTNQLIYRCWNMLKWWLSPYLKFIPRIRKHYEKYRIGFNNDELQKLQKQRMNEQIDFYKKKGLSKSDLKKIKCL